MRPSVRSRTLGQLIENTEIPQQSFGTFWLGGASLAVKTARQRVYLIDPAFSDLEHGGPVGTIDLRPDLVLCTMPPPGGIDLSTLANLSTAFPKARFVGSAETRDWLVGRGGSELSDEVPVNPDRVHALEHGTRLDVRQVHVADALKLRILCAEGDTSRAWNVLCSFGGGLLAMLVRDAESDPAVEALLNATKRKVDVLLWTLESDSLERAKKVVGELNPRYVIPIGYDRLPSGRDLARDFREMAGKVGGVQVYLFADDYMEGAIYSRITNRRRGL